MKSIVIILSIFTTSLCFSQNVSQLREPSSIRVGEVTLEQFLKIHAEGMERMEKSKDKTDSNLATEQLAAYLTNRGLSINDLKEADLSNANLRNVDLRFLNLKEANLQNADFAKANLDGANLKEANLENAGFTEATLVRANLKEANLENADLTKANLEGADLKEANVAKATFRNSNLKDVDIHEAEGLTLGQLLTCKSLYHTKLPEDLLSMLRKGAAQLLEAGSPVKTNAVAWEYKTVAKKVSPDPQKAVAELRQQMQEFAQEGWLVLSASKPLPQPDGTIQRKFNLKRAKK